jgi:hypothetical protein
LATSGDFNLAIDKRGQFWAWMALGLTLVAAGEAVGVSRGATPERTAPAGLADRTGLVA